MDHESEPKNEQRDPRLIFILKEIQDATPEAQA